MKRSILSALSFALLLLTAQSCTTGDVEVTKTEDKQLNIVVLLDLSDRIAKDAVPSHKERDMAVVKSLTEMFRADMGKRGTFRSKGKMKIVFSPVPQDPNIAAIAGKLSVDLSEMKTPAEKKIVYDNIEKNFSNGLEQIYEQSLSQQNWIGCDIWRFFKDDIDLYLDRACRNVVVILTDGYLYHKNSMIQQGHRYSYLTASMLKSEGLRDELEYAEKIEKNNIGFISMRNDLDKVEVLVLECDPVVPVDYDVMKSLYGKWFSEMGVSRCSVFKTGMPVDTRSAIKEFINQ